MKRYHIVAEVTISVHIDVEASSEAEARDIADASPMMELCHACATGHDGEWSTSGELDGEPRIVSVEERAR